MLSSYKSHIDLYILKVDTSLYTLQHIITKLVKIAQRFRTAKKEIKMKKHKMKNEKETKSKQKKNNE